MSFIDDNTEVSLTACQRLMDDGIWCDFPDKPGLPVISFSIQTAEIAVRSAFGDNDTISGDGNETVNRRRLFL
ncbi:MAG: hypothetical protein HGB15_05975 [Chlorobaculum sp.]|jgi:hypothetical protein|nr:hypothetical protein [Chlorobaculum sp.]